MKKEEFKNYNIICINEKEIKECFKLLEEMGHEVDDFCFGSEIIVLYQKNFNKFKCFNSTDNNLKNISFYNFKKEANKILKEEEKKLEDFEVASDGRITKVNNWESNKKIYNTCFCLAICNVFPQNYMETDMDCGLVYATEEARDKAVFKLKIETKLKNIAERLNNGKKIDWGNHNQKKYYIYYDYYHDYIDFVYDLDNNYQGTIYCLNENFLDEAIKEIGEENLIKYFKEC